MTRIFWLTLIIVSTIFAIGCSGGGNSPVQPDDTQLAILGDIAPFEGTDTGNHAPGGMWEMVFDPDSMKITVEPSRDLTMHYNITSLFPPPEIAIVGYNPVTRILEVNVLLTNPFPIAGYDLRLIIYFNGGNNPRLVNEDGWTSLFDIGGGYPINPFKAYAKQAPSRKFDAYAHYVETLNILFPSNIYPVSFAIDVSYPSNCGEPYMIANFGQQPLYDAPLSEAIMLVDVFDWQNDITSVNMMATAITGEPATPFANLAGEKWIATCVNNNAAPPGIYPAMFWATSTNSGSLYAYNVFWIRVRSSDIWPAAWGGTDYDIANDVAVDDPGNTLIVGDFHGNVDFDPGSGTKIVSSRDETQDSYLLMLDPDGRFKNVFNWGGEAGDELSPCIALDSEDYIFLAGSYEGTADLNPGDTVTEFTSNGGKDIFLMKLDSNGNLVWIWTWGGPGDDIAFDIAVDNQDFVYVTGYFNGTVDFEPGPGEYKRTSKGVNDCFLVRYSYHGYYQWARTWGGTSVDSASTVTCDSEGSAYVAGKYNSTVDFNPADGEDEIYTANGNDDVFLTKFFVSGSHDWAGTWGANFLDAANELVMYGDNRIYLIGTFAGAVDFDPGLGETIVDTGFMTNTFITVFDANRNLIDLATWGGASAAYGWGLTIYNDELFACGQFTGTVDFNPGVEVDEKSSLNASYDAFLMRLDTDLNYDWSRTWGGLLEERGQSVACYQNMDICTVGNFQDSVDFDPGPGEVIRSSKGGFDAFATRYDINGSFIH